jgi:DNA-3-methyladenine glycosylase
MTSTHPVARSFFERSALDVAPQLIGALIVVDAAERHEIVRIVEVEAYGGANDPASHAYRGPTARNAAMFGPPGHWYVYFTYGMHWCMNVVCESDGTPGAVLIRAAEPVRGIDALRARRPNSLSDHVLLAGPARLTRALGVDGAMNGADACSGMLRIECSFDVTPDIATGPRVGIRNGLELPWRFAERGNRSVSGPKQTLTARD